MHSESFLCLGCSVSQQTQFLREKAVGRVLWDKVTSRPHVAAVVVEGDMTSEMYGVWSFVFNFPKLMTMKESL
ncbi:hypothetical protein TNIN_230721 [Trichonephila inaurata madagascariensis]|uniref:Uncharacterized protein n=1 Tax=Trichonephila inaurata madagascariensis TaxID=2747483 RepID=A0A8X6WR57_9ARAC|nr:hypothetical protein TNIN_230721 [Trichonephila inaurata madagascariensis]